MAIIQSTSRRGFLTGMASLFAAPAIVSAQNLMPVKVIPFDPYMIVRGRDILTNAIIETRLYEKAGDPFAFLNDAFYTRLGKATSGLSMSGLETAAIESRADEKALKFFQHPEPQAFRLHHESAPFVVQVKNPSHGHEERFYVAYPPDNVFCSAKHNRRG